MRNRPGHEARFASHVAHHIDRIGAAQNGIALAANAIIAKMPGSSVDAQEVEGCSDGFHITRLDRWHGVTVLIPGVLWITAPSDGVDKPEIEAGMVEASEFLVGPSLAVTG